MKLTATLAALALAATASIAAAEGLPDLKGRAVTVVTENAGNLIVEVKGTQVALDKQVALKIIAG